MCWCWHLIFLDCNGVASWRKRVEVSAVKCFHIIFDMIKLYKNYLQNRAFPFKSPAFISHSLAALLCLFKQQMFGTSCAKLNSDKGFLILLPSMLYSISYMLVWFTHVVLICCITWSISAWKWTYLSMYYYFTCVLKVTASYHAGPPNQRILPRVALGSYLQ